MVLSSAGASSNEMSILQRARDEAEVTNVVRLAFCESSLSAEDKTRKKTLEEVHTYAELKDDPRASLPGSFTICSTIMITGCQSYGGPMFFNFL